MTSGKCCGVCKIVGLLAGLGALNWGFVGVFQFEPIAKVFGMLTGPTRIIYSVIGLAGLLKLLSLVKCCPCQRDECETKK